LFAAAAPAASADPILDLHETVTLPGDPTAGVCLIRVNLSVHHIPVVNQTICL